MKLPNFEDVEQNTDEWFAMRAGKMTSSKMGTVMANYGKAFGDPAKKLAAAIAVEQITGRPIGGGYSNDHMERGHEQEPLARALYEATYFCDVTNGGFFHGDSLGCSPDGLVADSGVIEIKSVIPHVHYANIKRQGVDPAYKWQVSANLMFTGREWIDFVSYCADFPPEKQLYTHRIYAADQSEEFIKLRTRLGEFINEIKTSHNLIMSAKYYSEASQ